MAIRFSRTCVLLFAGALGTFAVAPSPLVAQPAQTNAPPIQPTAPPTTTPPTWAQGRPDSEAVAKIAPVAPPPLAASADKLPLTKLKLPAGFNIEVFASGVGNARTLRVDDKGTVFVSSRTLGRVYALVDKDGKRELRTIATG